MTQHFRSVLINEYILRLVLVIVITGFSTRTFAAAKHLAARSYLLSGIEQYRNGAHLLDNQDLSVWTRTPEPGSLEARYPGIA